MCLIALAWKVSPDYPLIVGANRDEWRSRPAAPAAWWPEAPQVLAGRDLEAGGSWLGLGPGGRFAALTNFRDPSERRQGAPSRGTLVRDFLAGSAPPRDFLQGLRERAGAFAGFNLLAGDRDALFCFSSRNGELLPVPPGIHALSNHTLDEPWPKVQRARAALDAALAGDPLRLPAAILELLSDPLRAADADLPDTGVGLPWERRLSPALITGEDYGTRCSTVVLVGRSGAARFEEHTRDPEGRIVGTAAFEVRWE